MYIGTDTPQALSSTSEPIAGNQHLPSTSTIGSLRVVSAPPSTSQIQMAEPRLRQWFSATTSTTATRPQLRMFIHNWGACGMTISTGAVIGKGLLIARSSRYAGSGRPAAQHLGAGRGALTGRLRDAAAEQYALEGLQQHHADDGRQRSGEQAL